MKVKHGTYYICDICGNKIEEEFIPIGVRRKIRYSFKYECNGRVESKDMCRHCFENIKEYIRRFGKNEQSNIDYGYTE